ncbi:ATP-binding protein [Streptomyces flaveolus]|uniref:ATP-binding protein n=1 Tax=Streptomyces flaveolus TaxID=67297 RepID=A0ABV3APW8_9ACTN
MTGDGARTGLLGRRNERGFLDDLLAPARTGRSGVLVVRGEAGIGKTELLNHLLDRATGCGGALQGTGVRDPAGRRSRHARPSPAGRGQGDDGDPVGGGGPLQRPRPIRGGLRLRRTWPREPAGTGTVPPVPGRTRRSGRTTGADRACGRDCADDRGDGPGQRNRLGARHLRRHSCPDERGAGHRRPAPEAIEQLDTVQARMDGARARLRYGEWLRREQRRTEARSQLSEAHEMLGEAGAEAFAERA